MHRQILISLLPCLAALAAAFVALRLLARLSGARLNLGRLRELHRCQDGGVQSLSFVLTLPLFLMIVMFIVQVSQLMIGLMVINHAAYAAARSACVWIPAHAHPENEAKYDPEWDAENHLPPPISAENPLVLQYLGNEENDSISGGRFTYDSYKYERIFAAAVMGCAPIAPSRDLGYTVNGPAGETVEAAKLIYAAMAPQSRQNARIPERIENKIAYTYWNTLVRIRFDDKDSPAGPTYNPRVAVRVEDPPGSGNFVWKRVYNRHEVGWQDPITVTVTHRLALLPGPGRFLAKHLVRADGEPLIEKMDEPRGPEGERVYTVAISASATMTNEGLKPVISYEQRP